MNNTDTYIPYKKPGTKSKYDEKEIRELAKCSIDPFHFIENYIYVLTTINGTVKFKPYDYQKDFIKSIHENRSTVACCFRQGGKTTAAASYLLWSAMFIPGQTILIVGNKRETAIEILDRIKFMYEHLENWIRDSATEYNKTSMKFSNGSKIICRATSKSSANGLSVSLLYSDELSKLSPNIQQEFYSSIKPTLSTGGKFVITSTPNHDEDIFAQIWKGANDTIDEHGNISEVGSNGFKAIKAIWSDCPDRTEEWAEVERKSMGDEMFLREYCCEFISEDETLINPLALTRLRSKQPEYTLGTVRFYKEISPEKTYIVALDPSAGVGGDCASIQILEMPSMEHVGEWMHNRTPPREQVRLMINILKFIKQKMMKIGYDDSDIEPNLFWSFENNSVGEAIISLVLELGEEQFPGTLINEPKIAGHIKKFRRGLHTTNRNKVLACSKLKTFIDTDRMKINSPGLIYQLKNFVSSGVGFSGKPGINDDLVMAMIIAVRIALLTSNWGAFSPDVLKENIDDEEDELLMPIICIH